jgi:two-component system sensor histidine kinase KdpD
LAGARGTDKLLEIGVNFIAKVFNSEVLALMPDNGRLVIRARCRTNQILNEKEQGVAQWVYDLGQTAGLGTDSLSFTDALYLPLLGSQGVIGVSRLKPLDDTWLDSPEQLHLLEICVNQIALALEVDRLQESTKIIK